MKLSDYRYDLGVKGQHQVYLRTVLWIITQTFMTQWFFKADMTFDPKVSVKNT